MHMAYPGPVPPAHSLVHQFLFCTKDDCVKISWELVKQKLLHRNQCQELKFSYAQPPAATKISEGRVYVGGLLILSCQSGYQHVRLAASKIYQVR